MELIFSFVIVRASQYLKSLHGIKPMNNWAGAVHAIYKRKMIFKQFAWHFSFDWLNELAQGVSLAETHGIYIAISSYKKGAHLNQYLLLIGWSVGCTCLVNMSLEVGMCLETTFSMQVVDLITKQS